MPLPDGGMVVPAAYSAELAAALELLDAFLRGTPPPGSVTAPRMTGRMREVQAVAQEAALRHRQQENRRGWAAPTAPHVPVLPPAQPVASSDGEMVTTEQAAVLTGFSAEWVRRLAASGVVRGRKGPRNTWEVDLEDVRAYRAGRPTHERHQAGPGHSGTAGRSAA